MGLICYSYTSVKWKHLSIFHLTALTFMGVVRWSLLWECVFTVCFYDCPSSGCIAWYWPCLECNIQIWPRVWLYSSRGSSVCPNNIFLKPVLCQSFVSLFAGLSVRARSMHFLPSPPDDAIWGNFFSRLAAKHTAVSSYLHIFLMSTSNP